MNRKHLIAGAAVLAAVAGGTAGAIAAGDDHKAAEKAVLADAAKQLGVDAGDLRDALAKAEDAQIDEAVKAGRLTQEQADEIKQHRAEDGSVLGFGHGGPHGPGGPPGRPGFGGPHPGPGPGLLDSAAKALGISERKLMTQLRNGKSLAAIAKANGKSLDDVKAAVKKAPVEQLDADVKAGRLTPEQRDEIAGHLDDAIDHLGEFPHFRGGHERGFPPPGRRP
jgi:hypothetical protein